jgi:exodeoxyribonuclease VII large subunit
MSQNLHNPLSLSDVTKLVDQWFREMFGEWKFRFVAELSQIKSTKGRYYLDLVQFDDQQAIIAKCRWVVFQASIIDSLITGGTISQIGELKWAKLLMSGVCNFHYEYGFSIIIQDISQEYLVWQFEKYKQDTIKILQELGIIDHNRKIQLGFPPYHIAIISSPTSEGLKDFMTILDESGYRVSTTLYPTMIHGNDAKLQVYQTLKTLYQSIQSWQKIDLVAIIRGGWGSHGIMRQNDLNIAKGICYLQVPVMIAIWHTSDQFLLHQLCRFPAKTPSDGAHMIVSMIWQYDSQVDLVYSQIVQQTLTMIDQMRDQLDACRQFIQYRVDQIRSQSDKELMILYHQILRYDSDTILAQWYAILENDQGHILSIIDQKDISSGDILQIRTHSLKIQVRVQQISDI